MAGKEIMTESHLIDLDDVIGVYALFNTGAILVHKIDYGENRVLASINGKDPEWCGIVEGYREDDDEDEDDEMNTDGDTDEEGPEPGFFLGSIFVPFSQVLRFGGGGK
jgi:hypothetical protein